MKKILAQLFLLIFSVNAFAQTPTWPLDMEISQSSSFAEFRGFRFHAGIDLRTNRQVGYPVRAIEDGFVSRIKVQFRGYGYAIYIDHPKINKRVVYGHLQDFVGPLKEYTDKKLQKIGQRFGIDDFFGPDRFPVKKGQVVAISGETGSGPPHLHFEVRNMADEPEAPALIGFRPADEIYPSFHHLYVEPFSYPCEINRSFQTARLNILPARKGWASVSEPLQVSGKVGFKVGISDNNGLGNVFGVESIALALDAKTIFARNFNRYSYDQNSQCIYVYDYIRSNLKGTGYVVKLFKLQGENLPFSAEYMAGAGIINIPDKTSAHHLEINVSDFGGNRIMLKAEVERGEANYDAIIPSQEILDNYRIDNFVTNSNSLVLLGTRKNGQAQPFHRGGLLLADGSGQKASIPVIISGKGLEIAIPITSRWEKGVWLENQRLMPDCLFVDQRGRKVFSNEGGLAEFPAGSLSFPILARFFRANLTPASGGSKKAGFLKAMSSTWRLDPEDVVFADSVKIKILPQKYDGNMSQLGVYKVKGPGKYSHVGEKLENGWLVAQTRLGGEWVVLCDDVCPTLGYKGKGKDYHLGKVWIIDVSDLGEGVDYLSASATVNGKKSEVYSDPDKSEIYVVRPEKTKKAELELKIKDNAGNQAVFKKTL